MFTLTFWRAALERAIKTFAQALLAVGGVGATGILDVDWKGALSAAALAACASILTSIVSDNIGPDGPSVGGEVLPTEPAPGDRVGDSKPSGNWGGV